MKQKFRQRIYRLLLRFLGFGEDYKGDIRSSLGVSPYARRSPLLLAIYNLRELNSFLADRSDTKFFRPATRALRNSKATSLILPHWAKDLQFSRITPLEIFYYCDCCLSAPQPCIQRYEHRLRHVKSLS